MWAEEELDARTLYSLEDRRLIERCKGASGFFLIRVTARRVVRRSRGSERVSTPEMSPEMQKALAQLEDLEFRGLMTETLEVLSDVPLLARIESVGKYKPLLHLGEVIVEDMEKRGVRASSPEPEVDEEAEDERDEELSDKWLDRIAYWCSSADVLREFIQDRRAFKRMIRRWLTNLPSARG